MGLSPISNKNTYIRIVHYINKTSIYTALTLETNESSDRTAKFFSIRSFGIEMLFS